MWTMIPSLGTLVEVLQPAFSLPVVWLKTPGTASQQGQQLLVHHLCRRHLAARIGNQDVLSFRQGCYHPLWPRGRSAWIGLVVQFTPIQHLLLHGILPVRRLCTSLLTLMNTPPTSRSAACTSSIITVAGGLPPYCGGLGAGGVLFPFFAMSGFIVPFADACPARIRRWLP